MDDGTRQGIPDPFDPAQLDLASQRLRHRAAPSRESAEPVDRLEDSLRRLHRYAQQIMMQDETVSRAAELLRDSDPRPQGALVPLLLLFQEAEQGRFCSDGLVEHVAAILELPPAQVRGVVTFHPSLGTLDVAKAPVGRCIRVCSGLSCSLMGARRVRAHLEEYLGIEVGGHSTTAQVSLQSCQCPGSCSTGPIMMIDGVLHESLTVERINTILQALDMGVERGRGGQAE